MEQIDSTIAMAKDLGNCVKFPRIIFKGAVNVTNSLRTAWNKKHGGRVKIKRNVIEESVCHDE